MSNLTYERPGVYSSYDASSIIDTQGGATVGVAARSAAGTAGAISYFASYDAALAVYGADGTGQNMMALIKLLFQNGAGQVAAAPVAVGEDVPAGTDYEAVFGAMGSEDGIAVMICDSTDEAVHAYLKTAVEEASTLRRERIAVVGGGADESVSALTARAEALDSERVVLMGPAGTAGGLTDGIYLAAAAAGAIAGESDPAVPLGGAALGGITAVSAAYTDTEINTLVRGGVTPVECVGGTVSVVRGVTTRTTTAGVPDATWRELSTILIVDSVIPSIRNSLRAKFARTKNTAQQRGAIRSQVILELEDKKTREIITDYGSVGVSVSASSPTVCQVEFSFAVAHGLNQIILTAHITV